MAVPMISASNAGISGTATIVKNRLLKGIQSFGRAVS